MKYLENLLKSRLQDGTSHEGVDADDLWANIADGLPPEKKESKTAMVKRIGWLFLLVLLCTFLGFHWQKWSSSASSSTPTTTPVPATSPTTVCPSTSLASSPVVIASHPATTTTAAHTIASTNEPANTQPIISAYTAPNLKPVTSRNPSSAPTIATRTLTATSQSLTDNTSTNNIEPNHNSALVSNKIILPTSPTLRSLALPEEVLSEAQQDVTLPGPVLSPTPLAAQPALQFGVFSGVNLWKSKLRSSPLSQRLNEANNYAIGQSYAVELRWHFRHQLHLISGLGYTRAHEQFNYTQITTDTFMFRDNIPGADLINAVATRTVKQHNSQHFFSVPVLLEAAYPLGQFELGLAAGLRLNYISEQNGKSLNTDARIVSYDSKNGGKLPYQQFFLAFQFRPMVNFRASSRLSFQLRPDIRYQVHGKSSLYDSSQNSWLTGLSVGVLYGGN